MRNHGYRQNAGRPHQFYSDFAKRLYSISGIISPTQ